jgi:hypothetical protein
LVVYVELQKGFQQAGQAPLTPNGRAGRDGW